MRLPTLPKLRGRALTVCSLLLSNSLILLAGFVTGILTARFLGPEDRGALAAILLWPQILAAVGLFSLNEAVLIRLAQAPACRSSIGSAVHTAGLLAVGSVACGWWLVPAALTSIPSVAGIGTVFMVLYIPSNYVGLVLLAAEQAQGNYGVFNVLRIAGPACYLIATVWLAAAGKLTVVSAAAVTVGASGLVASLLALRYRHRWVQPVSSAECRNWLRFVRNIHPLAVVSLVSSQMDRIAVAALLEPRSLGFYTAALTVSGALLGVVGATAQSYLVPELCRERGQAGRRTIITQGLGLLWLALAVGAVALITISPWTIPLLFGEAYREAVQPAILAVIAYVPFAQRQTIVRLLRALDKHSPGYISEALSVAVFVLLVGPLHSAMGLSGLCWAMIAANAVALAYCTRGLHSLTGVRPLRWLIPRPGHLFVRQGRLEEVAA